ncbi:MAG: glycogen synthase [Hominisplanchenecus sp.]
MARKAATKTVSEKVTPKEKELKKTPEKAVEKAAVKAEEKAEAKEEPKAAAKEEAKLAAKAEVKPEEETKAPAKKATKKTVKKEAVQEAKEEPKAVAKKAAKPAVKAVEKAEVKEEPKAAAKKKAAKAEEKAEVKEEPKAAAKKAAKPAAKTEEKTEEKEELKVTSEKEAKEEGTAAENAAAAVQTEETVETEAQAEETVSAETKEPEVEAYVTPRRSVVFIGSECYPFVKTGGLGDVMYALPKALVKQNCDVKVILPRYKCIPWEYQQKMIYRGSFEMNLCSDGRSYYVGIMEYVWDGVVYDFIDNEEFFGNGNPYTNLIDDIPKYCYFAKAALAALNYMNWVPDIIHCHDWQAALVPVYLRTLFENTKLTSAKTILTIHNLRFQGIYNIPTIRYWSGLPDYVFNKDALKVGYRDANMLKGGLTYANVITTVSNTYAGEIQTGYYGEKLDAHLRYHSGKLRGIVNGIDYDIWNTATDSRLYANYDLSNVLDKKKENKRNLQQELGLVQDDHKFVIGLISRLTDQKGLDLVNAILPQIMDEHTQVVVLGTGDAVYEDSFRYYENAYKGNVCSNIMYDETRAHKIYAGADALLVPSQFEPCGLTQLIAMHYGTIPIVRETGGLKDTVEPYNKYYNTGNGFTFNHYDAGLLLDAINRAKTLYFTNRWCWDEMVQRDMDKNLSWDNSAKQYKDLYLELTRDKR